MNMLLSECIHAGSHTQSVTASQNQHVRFTVLEVGTIQNGQKLYVKV